MARLALGTVQFGLRYGVANQAGRTSASEAAAILQRAAQAGIDTLDTAVAYGDSEACLGSIGVSGWRVVSKLPPLPQEVGDVSAWTRDQVRQSLRRLGIAQLEALLLHRSADLLGEHGTALASALERCKQEGWTRTAGVSIYDPAELDALWDAWRPEVVQAPFNVLDRRLLQSGWLERLSEHRVRIHVRSVFLQGLLLMPPAARPASFAPWGAQLDGWLEWCRQCGAAPLQAALAFVAAEQRIERIVVGVDCVRQLDEILAATATAVPPVPASLASEDCDLIEPRRWRVA